MVMISMGIMTSAIACLVGTCYFPRWEILLGGGIVFGLGYGMEMSKYIYYSLLLMPIRFLLGRRLGLCNVCFITT